MRLSLFLLLPLPLVVLACGGSDAGSVFDQPAGDDSGATADTAATDTSVPTSDADPPPPLDTGTIAEDTSAPPPPTDTGIGIDTALPPPPLDAGLACTEPGSKTFGGHCYFPTTSTRWWTTTRDACIAAGAHLVTINSAEEQAVVQTIGTGERWTGLYRPDGSPFNSGSYRWVTPEMTSYRNWAPMEPNFSGQCVRMLPDGRWADQRCDVNVIGICERE